jgi:CRISPR-associated endonuclease/helicase Cas3
MLAERAVGGDWPEAINLPTASGKTACLDAAIFGLAATAGQGVEKRLPRRIWFVVDRRIVVDEAFQRAQKIAARLARAESGPLSEAAQILRDMAGSDRPLGVARLRGGAWTSKDWARLPGQPTIICSTVDQVGSALLFRAYGHSDETASIYAGLAAQDSLILLDEAHCAVPFVQTLAAVARYRDEPWGERPLKTPFRYCIMSATPPEGVRDEAVFPRPAERAAALDHPRLQQRLTARKLATLVKPVKGNNGEFASEAARVALEYVEDEGNREGKRRVAVMVNRVATAQEIAGQLRRKSDDATVVLMTGRMRPLDRDALVDEWGGRLKAGSTEPLGESVIVVTTQCLEVGADFSFDALVTECASLDALRQRFGRLDRLGELRESRAAILIRERDAKNPKDDGDPIYGKAIYETWKWLNEADQRQEDGTVDFGAATMDSRAAALRSGDEVRFKGLLAPAPDAPVLLPSHLDLLCQTSPRPTPEPDAALFLHGKGRAAPEVRVVFRADLTAEDEDAWIETLCLVPPTSPEMLTVPLHRLRRWLRQETPEDEDGDVEGAREETDRDEKGAAGLKFLIWRGRERSAVTTDAGRVRPNDVVVLRLSEQGIFELGQRVDGPDGLGAGRLDLAEHALSRARRKAVLRVCRDVLEPLCDHPLVARLVELAESDPEREEVRAALKAILGEEEGGPFLGEWLKEIIASLSADHFLRIEEHPVCGLVLIGKTSLSAGDEGIEDDLFADADDLTSKSGGEVSWRQHTASVYDMASEFARCISRGFAGAITAAAQAHDLGKLDWRFQLLLHDGDEVAASSGDPLAKSVELPERRRKRRQVAEDARLPKGFRHEFFSMQLADHFRLIPTDEEARELALHLIASHHGYARPFAPVVPDGLVAAGLAGSLCLNRIGMDATLSAAERQALTPAYRLDSGVPDRFWRLTRRYGWWGLAYLEGTFRLADWEASRKPGAGLGAAPVIPSATAPARPAPRNPMALDALDGANPLAFLAALGTLRVLTRVLPHYDPRLSWEQRLGAWRPLLWTAMPVDEAMVCNALSENGMDLSAMFSEEILAAGEAAGPRNKKGEASWKDRLLFPVKDFRHYCCAASRSPSVGGEFAAAWAGETAPKEMEGKDVARRTRFDFTAGPQRFVGMLRELRKSCTAADIRHALFNGWHYSTAAASMRWDTQDEKRQYALQSVDPTNNSKNPPMADRGANFLATEALPLFPLVPNRWADQAGFEGEGEGRRWSWPIWTHPLSLEVVRSLLAVPFADSEEWSAAGRHEIGVSVIFQSRIVMPSGRYRCFTPARSL